MFPRLVFTSILSWKFLKFIFQCLPQTICNSFEEVEVDSKNHSKNKHVSIKILRKLHFTVITQRYNFSDGYWRIADKGKFSMYTLLKHPGSLLDTCLVFWPWNSAFSRWTPANSTKTFHSFCKYDLSSTSCRPNNEFWIQFLTSASVDDYD